ncbi:hypothetical protein SAMN05661096_03128 [Marivirga sericea]|uniref:Uncharacterized protein n=1 Tax=Marivirga sericea TaxID=1028 RepID=A0A1X7KVF7_9BACT|nr:hypothetical protein SAMN05661096_03128 [Marivirga sericea]
MLNFNTVSLFLQSTFMINKSHKIINHETKNYKKNDVQLYSIFACNAVNSDS